MASKERFEALLAKADSAAGLALRAVPDTRGSERGTLQATIAAMWLETARIELALVDGERLERKIAALTARVRTLEARAGIAEWERFPDPFAAGENRDTEIDGDDPKTAGV